MDKKEIFPFRFYDLKVPSFFELATSILGTVLPPESAQELGLDIPPYNDTKKALDRLTDIFLRNPAMLQTEDLVEIIAAIRRKMVLLKNTFKEMLADAKGERFQDARELEYVARPYLKNIHKDEQSALAAKAKEMGDALRSSANLTKLAALGLKPLVDEIAAQGVEAGRLITERGEEQAFQREIGTATEVRKLLEKHLRTLLYISIPAHYLEATGALETKYEQTIIAINGTLDGYRHLTASGKHGGHDGGIGEDYTPKPVGPDTQPALPPDDEDDHYNGGTYIDPNA